MLNSGCYEKSQTLKIVRIRILHMNLVPLCSTKNFVWCYILWNHPYVQSYECKQTELPCGTVCNEVRTDSYLYVGIRHVPRSLCHTHGNHVRNLLPSCHYSNLLQDLFLLQDATKGKFSNHEN